MPRPEVYGWDIGGAHVKACRLQAGEVVDVAQWACPLWQGEHRLAQVLQSAHARWPQLRSGCHAATMTGEMVDAFAHREQGVRRIAARLFEGLAAPDALHFYAGDGHWCAPGQVAQHWAAIASANWLATATHTALVLSGDCGVLVDIGSTTTDLIAFGSGRVLCLGRTDAQRLASGELVYQGVVRTPLCALGPRMAWRGQSLNVMNEFFATTADVYRLTGELPAAHDLHPAADGGGKDAHSTRQRLARMIGLDARDATADEWLAFARAWRDRQLAELRGQLERVLGVQQLGREARWIGAGCGDFLLPDLLAPLGLGAGGAYATQVARVPAGSLDRDLAAGVQVCAPAVAVASLLDRERC
jgi:probable H4MPT-linked C1 transfer pathway protein